MRTRRSGQEPSAAGGVCARPAQRAGNVAAYLPLAQLRAHGPEALEGWHGARVLAVDDLELVAGQLPWEQRLFGLYREVQERGAALIAAAIEPPLLLRFCAARSGLASLPLPRCCHCGRCRKPDSVKRCACARTHAAWSCPRRPRCICSDAFAAICRRCISYWIPSMRPRCRRSGRLTVPFIRSVLALHAPERARAPRRAGPVPAPAHVHRALIGCCTPPTCEAP